jgi:transcriptional regulator with XRE-family HTH domain
VLADEPWGPEVDQEEVGARVAAARVYARLTPDELAKSVRDAAFPRFSKRTLARVEAGERHLDVREARVIAQTCDVPLSFLVRGWWAPPDLVTRVAGFEDALTHVENVQDEHGRILRAVDELLQAQLGTSAITALGRSSESPGEEDQTEEG